MSALENVDALLQMISGMHKQYSSAVRPLNDQTAEYVVSTVKHFYEQLVIVQYGIKNTLDDHVLSGVTLRIENFANDCGLAVRGVIPLAEGDSIRVADQKFVYLILDRAACQSAYPTAKIKAALTMTITEIDLDTEEEVGSYEEDYDIPEVSVAIRDYIKADIVPQGQFKDLWETIGSHERGSEVTQTYALPFKNLEDAVEGVTKNFGMSVCDGSNKVNVTEKAHNLLLSGLFMNKEMILVRAIIGFNVEYGCVLKVVVRSMNESVSNIMLEVINE